MKSGQKTCVARQAVVQKIGKAKTPAVVLNCQVVEGTDEGQFVKWQGWINTPENLKRTVEQLRIAGWRGSKIRSIAEGKLEGLGTRRFILTVSLQQGTNREGVARMYPRGDFIRQIPTVAGSDFADHELDAFDRDLAELAPEADADGVIPDDDLPADYHQAMGEPR